MKRRLERKHGLVWVLLGTWLAIAANAQSPSFEVDNPSQLGSTDTTTTFATDELGFFINDTQDPRGVAPNGFLPKPVQARSFGFIEKITLGSETPLQFKAKLDTGADTSSLDAKNVKRIRRGDKRLVRFTVVNPDSGESITIERPYVRRVRIKRHSGNHQSRNVVRMEICLGAERRTVEMSLIDRGLFEYPVLLGRSALDGIALVDPGKILTVVPTCHFPTIKAIPEEIPLPLDDYTATDKPELLYVRPGQTDL